MDSAGTLAEFYLHNMRPENGGSYRCQYYKKSDPPGLSEKNDPLELVVKELYPKPNTSMTPSEEVTLGEDVTIRCWDQHEDMTLLLFKDRKRTRLQPQPQVSFGKVAEFHICSVTKEKEGKYSCYYQSKSYQEVWSHPSNSVNLVVEAATPGEPRILHPDGPWCHVVVPPGDGHG
ncbi:immunoglobulin superfamily member 1-like [Alligator mississippiensis]|uniref:immunoglobulin superfamily member 1-like n=1 Tax=Alligator mississippiensis TaxID=8496 RepID=UPI0003D0E847|nr:immunoglobulin superfamily member 1-like [Alligator mississippiensis]